MFDYNEYTKKYRGEKLELVSLRLRKDQDQDIIDALKSVPSKNQEVKRLIRLGIEASKNK